MESVNLLEPLFWPFLKLVLGLIVFALTVGLIAGLFTYGKPLKKQKSSGLMDDAMEAGMNLSHLLIGFIIGKFKGGSSSGTWLNDQEILAMMRGMRPSEFEQFVAKMFMALGYQAQLVGGSGDGGIDIEMTKDGRQHLVQCKKFITKKVNPHDIRDFFGAMGGRHVDGKGFFVTTNIFTREAERFAEGKPIELVDGIRLVQWVRESGVMGRHLETPTAESSTPPQREGLCPDCGGSLVLRANRNNGNRFWGCSRYPACRFTKSI